MSLKNIKNDILFVCMYIWNNVCVGEAEGKVNETVKAKGEMFIVLSAAVLRVL